MNPLRLAASIARKECQVLYQQVIAPLQAQAAATAYQSITHEMMIDTLCGVATKKTIAAVQEVANERMELWRILNLPQTRPFVTDGEGGQPLVWGAIDETEDGTTVHVLADPNGPLASLQGMTAQDADKGEAVRKCGKMVEVEVARLKAEDEQAKVSGAFGGAAESMRKGGLEVVE
jgi:hypothetical protein